MSVPSWWEGQIIFMKTACSGGTIGRRKEIQQGYSLSPAVGSSLPGNEYSIIEGFKPSHLLDSHLDNIDELSLLCKSTTLALLVFLGHLDYQQIKTLCPPQVIEPPSWRWSDWSPQSPHWQGRWLSAPAWRPPPRNHTPQAPGTKQVLFKSLFHSFSLLLWRSRSSSGFCR